MMDPIVKFYNLAIQPVSACIFALLSVLNALTGQRKLFFGSSSRLPKCDGNHRKRLWKRLFRDSSQLPSQSGNVGAMKFGKVPSCTSQAEAMSIIIRGMG